MVQSVGQFKHSEERFRLGVSKVTCRRNAKGTAGFRTDGGSGKDNEGLLTGLRVQEGKNPLFRGTVSPL